MIGSRLVRALGVILFSAGVVLGLAFSAVAIWGDLEAVRFERDLDVLSEASLTTLRCPVIMTGQEGVVHATFTNPFDRPVQTRIRARISRYITLMREEVETLSLAPGEERRLEWTVASDDIVYERLILVKVLQQRSYPLVGRSGSCGIVVLDLPGLTGTQVVVAAIVASLLGIGLGLGLWAVMTRSLRQPRQQTMRALGLVAGSTALAMLASLLGWWVLGGLALVVTILLIGAVLGHFVIWR
ncbi:MAG: hypothetical protein ACP5JJ_12925 [Anaerolineae bacterium]